VNLKVDLADFLNPTVIANTAQTCGYAMYTERARLRERIALAKNTPKWARNWGNCTMVGL